jgi:hypothetical protein
MENEATAITGIGRERRFRVTRKMPLNTATGLGSMIAIKSRIWSR